MHADLCYVLLWTWVGAHWAFGKQHQPDSARPQASLWCPAHPKDQTVSLLVVLQKDYPEPLLEPQLHQGLLVSLTCSLLGHLAFARVWPRVLLGQPVYVHVFVHRERCSSFVNLNASWHLCACMHVFVPTYACTCLVCASLHAHMRTLVKMGT